MAFPPPPYANVTGTSAIIGKYNQQENIANADGNARPGQLVVDLNVDPPLLYIGNNLGNLSLVGGGGSGNGTPGGGDLQVQYNNAGAFGANANFSFNPTTQTLFTPDISVTGNIVPTLGNTFNLGSPTLKWANIYVGPNSIFIQDTANSSLNAEIQVTNGVLYINGVGAIAANTILNGNSAIYIQPNGNINFSSAGGPNVLVVTHDGSNFSGYANVVGNLSVAGTANIIGATDVTGNLTVDGNVDFTGANVAIGSVANLFVGGGSNLQFLQTAGDGNLKWSNAVYNVTTGVGLTGGGTGNVGLDATGVQSITGAANRIIVTDLGGQNFNISAPQDLNTSSTLTFANLTITGTLTAANFVASGNSIVSDKILNLAYDSTSAAQIDQGGIILGNANASYSVSILYDLPNNQWNTDGAGLTTLNLQAANANIDFLNVQNGGHFGLINESLDYPNAYIQVDSNVNSYSQIISQNHSSGTSASSDLVLVNDIGDDSNHYIDLGINGSNYVDPAFSSTTANDGYLFVNQGNLVIGTDTTGQVVKFVAGGTTSNDVIVTIANTGLTASHFAGEGGNISNIAGANVGGYVANATHANIANLANSVAGANVTGAVAFATTANSVAGANVTGAVNFATTANSVAGANVTGAVGYATVANSVAGGNVTGAVTLAINVSASSQPNITSTGSLVNTQTSSLGVGTAASGTTGEIRATNNITAYYSSDSKFKENIRPVPDALGIVTSIGSDLFDWTDEYIASHGGEDGYFVQKSDFGVIAQKVQQVFPQAIRVRPDGSLAVDYEKLATLSFGAFVQLLARVEVLESKLNQGTSDDTAG